MLAAKAYKLVSKNVGLKSNLSADREPLPSDDKDAGYDVGSTWVYNNETFTCVDSTVSKAVWSADMDLINYDTWSQLLAAISIVSPSYIGKYAIVANANGAPSSGITYKYGDTLSDYIVDGGAATFRINNQGATTYSVTTMPRTIVNPVVTSVMLTPTNKPSTKGYYIFTVNPSDNLPNGIGLNDIAYFDGTKWSCYQKYSVANTVLVANNASGMTQVTWRKFAGTWMSTADEYIPDSKEYQTGKLWSGKPVYRKCINGTTGTAQGTNQTSLQVPLTGKILIVQGMIQRSDNIWCAVCGIGAIQIFVASNGYLVFWFDGTQSYFTGRPFTAWIEYTKS